MVTLLFILVWYSTQKKIAHSNVDAFSVRRYEIIWENINTYLSLAPSYTTWKHQKTRGFLMFSGGIERSAWYKWFIGILKETGFLRDSSMLVIRTTWNNKKWWVVTTFLRNEASSQVPKKKLEIRNFSTTLKKTSSKWRSFSKTVESRHRKFFRPDIFGALLDTAFVKMDSIIDAFQDFWKFSNRFFEIFS